MGRRYYRASGIPSRSSLELNPGGQCLVCTDHGRQVYTVHVSTANQHCLCVVVVVVAVVYGPWVTPLSVSVACISLQSEDVANRRDGINSSFRMDTRTQTSGSAEYSAYFSSIRASRKRERERETGIHRDGDTETATETATETDLFLNNTVIAYLHVSQPAESRASSFASRQQRRATSSPF